VRFFFDNCLSPRLAKALHALIEPRHEVVHLRDRFPQNVSDTEWIAKLAAEGSWVIISGDLRIRKRPQEREVWKAARLTTFFMAKAYVTLDSWEQVRWLIEKWPLIMDQADKVRPGAAFIVPRRGKQLEQA